MQLASATEQRMTGGQYLNREPVSREDFEAYGLGTVSNKASSTELYLDVLKRSLVNLIYYVEKYMSKKSLSWFRVKNVIC